MLKILVVRVMIEDDFQSSSRVVLSLLGVEEVFFEEVLLMLV